MKITCTVAEFAKMMRRCNMNSCYNCVMCDLCDNKPGIENFVAAEDVVPEETDEQARHFHADAEIALL